MRTKRENEKNRFRQLFQPSCLRQSCSTRTLDRNRLVFGSLWSLLACLGRVWGALGQALGVSCALLGVFWPPLERSWSHLNSHECLRGRFGSGLGASWLGFGKLWGQFSPTFSKALLSASWSILALAGGRVMLSLRTLVCSLCAFFLSSNSRTPRRTTQQCDPLDPPG